jgi:hypothetical protein
MKKQSKIVKFIYYGAILALVFIFGLFILEKSQVTNFYKKEYAAIGTQLEAKTTSDISSAQTDYTGGSEKPATQSNQDEKGRVKFEDTQGSGVVLTDKFVVSSDQNITVFSPQSNSLLEPSQVVSGLSKLDLVQYRVIDSNSGVIATGNLKVVDGKFSGIVTYSSTATEGRIDIFAVKQDGTEYANVELPVRFN